MKPESRHFYYTSNHKTFCISARFKGELYDILAPNHSLDVWGYSLSIEPKSTEDERFTLFESELTCIRGACPSINEFVLSAMTKMNAIFLAFATNHVTVLR